MGGRILYDNHHDLSTSCTTLAVSYELWKQHDELVGIFRSTIKGEVERGAEKHLTARFVLVLFPF